MAEKSSQVGVGTESSQELVPQWATISLARMSGWATAPPVIPLLTGLSFAASTAFLIPIMPPGFLRFIASPPWLLLPFVCLVLGVGLGFPLRRALMRILDTDRPSTGTRVVLGVGLAWIAAGLLQITLYYLLTA